jgi:urease accessory protein
MRPDAGRGHLAVERVAGESGVVSARAFAPLKLLTAVPRGPAAWVYVGTLGAGLLPGDRVALDVEVGARAALVLGTQASTKVFRGDARSAEQELLVRVGAGALAAIIPDPVACFDDAVFRQRQRFDLAGDASLVVIDTFSSGRAARGERWQFRSYRSLLEVFVDGVLRIREAIALEANAIPLADRFGEIDAYATVVVIGPACTAIATELSAHVAAMPVDARQTLFASASAIEGGTILRVGGRRVEEVTGFVRARLARLGERVGGDPWARRW